MLPIISIVRHITKKTIIIKAITVGEHQVPDTGSVLCNEQLTVIAAVADLIGNVRQPRYTARLTNEEEKKLGIINCSGASKEGVTANRILPDSSQMSKPTS
ncbi:hypothetical protein K449DRAFT_401096 [Hypoxylon sp. EC38]|nr:hypothetical protein K449DRAFT_401096 [Hypoxylon sp. EC38]